MKPSEDIFHLIKSLTTAEKRHFKLHCSKYIIESDNKYLLLFDAIDKQEIYNEEKIKKDCKSIKHLSVEKNRLYAFILKSLKELRSEFSAEDQLREQLKSINELYNNGLYQQCLKPLAKSKKIAYENECFILLLDIVDWERRLAYIQKINLKVVLNNAVNETQVLLEKIQNIVAYKKIRDEIYSVLMDSGAVRNDQSLRHVKKIIEHPLMKSESMAISITSLILYNYIYILFYRMLGETEKEYEYSKRGLELTEKEKWLIPKNFTSYINILGNHANAYLENKKYTEADKFIEKLKRIEEDFKISLSLSVQSNAYNIICSIQLYSYIKQGKFSEGMPLVEDIKKRLNNNSIIIEERESIFIYMNIAVLCFGSEKYNESLKWINKIKNSYLSQLSNEFLSSLLILELLVHYELNNVETLPYYIRSTNRILNKKNVLHQFEKELLKFMTHLNRVGSADQRIKLFRKFKSDLLSIKADDFQANAIKTSDLFSWIDSKIENRSLEDIVKEKAKKISIIK